MSRFLFHSTKKEIMPRKILIVDDYEDARNALKTILEGDGYEVVEAADGVEAVESVKLSAPDLILMDFAMPRMNGIDAARAIRKFEHAAQIPILCVTAYGKQIQEEATEVRFDDVIAKPIDFESLPSIIRHYLKADNFPVEPNP
jgi:CheY-like chemotaxis protein